MKKNNEVIEFRSNEVFGTGLVTCNQSHIYVKKYTDDKFGIRYIASVLYDKYFIDEETYLEILEKIKS